MASQRPSTYKQYIYANIPKGDIEPNTFKLKDVPYPKEVPKTSVLLRCHYLSLDPAMRGWLRQTRSYVPPVKPGEVMRGQCLAQILETGSEVNSSHLKKGDWVFALTGWTEYVVLDQKHVEKLDVPKGCTALDFMSGLGMVALTAYFGMTKIGQLKAGETVVVSGAAGATGSIAGQIAKIKGCRVIGIAGSKDKCDFLTKELGFDVAINYKDSDWKQQLKQATPKYIDVYFDNTGGEILDACLGRAATFARFIMCGAISQYNSLNPQGPASFMTVISQRVTMRGFIVFDYASDYDSARKELAQWMHEGKLTGKLHILKGGLERAPSGLNELFAGANTGKMVVEVAPMEKAIESGSKL